ncbi:DNA-directed RNA polymerase III subunit rpc25 [Saitozyma podzolica]|uniref:DNA-directed RNA polymerase III subunit rpc25 n=1 Tax=Saitozyma podzolica TaxID=1890683 RepID=A0A427YMF6_9TREE|nr:DNA-directed RNA polymerase III subunit rpc25 [Saitozyma podzolica]
MFVLFTLRDTVPVAPKAFTVPPAITIQDSLNKKFANKLISDKGLALSVYDILTAEDGKVTWGNGMMYYRVSFRLMLFAPFVGEVIVGKVLDVTASYIRVSLDFFQDIYIPPTLLPPNSAYDPSQKGWFWYSDDEDRILTPSELLNTVVASRLYIDKGEPIRFRVDSVEWQDIRPEPPSSNTGPGAQVNGDADEQADVELVKKDPIEKAGYKVIGTIAESGLGVVSWWDGGGGDGELMEEGAEEE